MSANTTAPAPMGPANPLEPLALVPPDIAGEFQASRYLYLGTIGAFIWDILTTAGQDWRLLTKHAITLPTVVYFISRIATLTFLITALVFQTAPVGDCQLLLYFFGGCYVVSLTSTSCLFFLRVRAVLAQHKYVVWAFFVLWVINSGLSIEVPFALKGIHIGPTNRCINSEIKSYATGTLVVSVVHDTAVYLAISWKIVTSSRIGPDRHNISAHVKGTGLQGLSKSILQGNQIYYIITIIGNVVCMVLLLSTNVPPILRAMFNVPNIALENAMATRIFRAVKLQGAERSLLPGGGGYSSNSGGGVSVPRYNTKRTTNHEVSTDIGTHPDAYHFNNSMHGVHVKREVIATTHDNDIPLKSFHPDV